jgi:hypothetical protein
MMSRNWILDIRTGSVISMGLYMDGRSVTAMDGRHQEKFNDIIACCISHRLSGLNNVGYYDGLTVILGCWILRRVH